MKRLLALLLLMALLPLAGLAHQKGFGEFAMDAVNVREAPAGDILFKKQRGEELFILDWQELRGQTWYKVATYDARRIRPVTAWVRADMVLPPDALFFDVTQVAAFGNHLIALKADGSAVFGGERHKYASAMAGARPDTWREVTQVAAGFLTVYGLKADGSLYRWGIRGPKNGSPGIQKADGSLVPYAAIQAYDDNLLGLMADGSLFGLKGNLERMLQAGGVQAFCAWWSLYGAALVVGDGRVSLYDPLGASTLTTAQAQTLAGWEDVIKVAAGFQMEVLEGRSTGAVGNPLAAAIRKNGTVVALDPEMNAQVSAWQDIIKLCIGDGFLLGLTRGGRVLAAGEYQSKVAAETGLWEGIADLACGFDYAVGLTRDGRLLFAGVVQFSHN